MLVWQERDAGTGRVLSLAVCRHRSFVLSFHLPHFLVAPSSVNLCRHRHRQSARLDFLIHHHLQVSRPQSDPTTTATTCPLLRYPSLLSASCCCYCCCCCYCAAATAVSTPFFLSSVIISLFITPGLRDVNSILCVFPLSPIRRPSMRLTLGRATLLLSIFYTPLAPNLRCRCHQIDRH
jgi:hypothetical protein